MQNYTYMGISRAVKILVGVLTIGQLFAALALLIWICTTLVPLALSGALAEEPLGLFPWFGAMLLWVVLISLMSFGLVVFYVIHAATNHRLSTTMKVVWVALVLMFGALVQVLYYFMEVVSDRSITARFEQPSQA